MNHHDTYLQAARERLEAFLLKRTFDVEGLYDFLEGEIERAYVTGHTNATRKESDDVRGT